MKREVIEKNELFRGIKGESLDRMISCSRARIREYPAGYAIFSQEGTPQKLYALLKGRVAIVKTLSSGKKNILYEVEAGSTFGEDYFFDGDQKYWYDAEACTKSTVLEIPWEFFYCFCNEACAHHKQLVQNMLVIFSKKEWLTMRKLHIVSPTSLKERISIWLLSEADEDGCVKLKMNREALAEYLGVARPSLSRTLMKLKDEGMIDVGKYEIRIVDRERIENFYN